LSTKNIAWGNLYNKYRSGNPLARCLVRGYLKSLSELLHNHMPGQMLDVGCGEGYPLQAISFTGNSTRVVAMDLYPEALRSPPLNAFGCDLCCGSIENMPFLNRSFDLVLCLEVLEHLRRPDLALREVRRVCRGIAVFSVPREPLWRFLNVVRGAYLRKMGNTPGHACHWSRRSFLTFLQSEFHVVQVRSPMPWTMALCEV
jgi:2-polyprenyl-3-methyl-5-hydroxy-6-metoxy-1,4-benzoquinol methylase